MNKKRRFKGGEIPTSSMADIAFLLLIFFLVTTTIDMDKGLGIVLPAEGEELEIKKTNILNCVINSQGYVLLGGDPGQSLWYRIREICYARRSYALCEKN